MGWEDLTDREKGIIAVWQSHQRRALKEYEDLQKLCMTIAATSHKELREFINQELGLDRWGKPETPKCFSGPLYILGLSEDALWIDDLVADRERARIEGWLEARPDEPIDLGPRPTKDTQ